MFIDKELEAEALCARQSLRFLRVEALHDEHVLYVQGISRDQYGEVWRMDFDAEGEHAMSERVLRFDLTGEPNIPLCVIDDARRLHDYMRDRDQRGLATDPVNYGGGGDHGNR